MTANEIEMMPALLESDYCEFRARIRERLQEALENGYVIEDMKTIYGDFMRALSHTLDEYEAPDGTLEEITD
jgi:hypothetical protein